MQKTFGKLTATIESNYDSDGVNCYVTSGKFSNSLAVLDDTGGFDDGPMINPVVIDAIRAWAEANGY